MRDFLEEVAYTSAKSLQRRQRGCKRRASGCLLIALLLLLTICGLLFALVQQSGAAAAKRLPIVVYFLVDNSNSVFAADPDQLRLEAVRMFISYLGKNDLEIVDAVSVIYFGGDVITAVEFTLLDAPEKGLQITESMAAPVSLDWTDPAAALLQVQKDMSSHVYSGSPVIILLTDGKPEWDGPDSDSYRKAYAQQMLNIGHDLADDDVPVHIILFGDTAEIGEWQFLWQQLASIHPSSSLAAAATPEELIAVYHALAARLTGLAVKEMTVNAEIDGRLYQFEVPEGLAQLTLTVAKQNPTQAVTIFTPDEIALDTTAADITHFVTTTTETWVISAPRAGIWAWQVKGNGQVTMWQDYNWPITPLGTPVPSAAQDSRIIAVGTEAVPPSKAVVAPTRTQAPLPVNPATPNAALIQAPTPYPKSLTANMAKPDKNNWFWGGSLLLLLLGAGTVSWRQYRHRRPVVIGTLHALTGPGFANGRKIFELESLGKHTVTVGAVPADVPLAAARQKIVIEPGPGTVSRTEMWVSGSEAVTLNGIPLSASRRLEDAALIQLDGHLLRYENLRWRRAARTTGANGTTQNYLHKVR